MNTLTALARRWWLPLAAMLVGAVIGGGYALVKPPSYTATAYVVVVPGSGEAPAQALSFAQAYSRIVAEPEVLQRVSETARVGAAELAGRVQSTVSPDAPLLRITLSAERPAQAAHLANSVAGALIGYANYRTPDTRVRLASFGAASPPAAPATPIPPLDIAAGAAAGLLAGVLAMLAGLGRTPARSPRRRPAEEPAPLPTTPTPQGAAP
ncbi:Wzz/FepE/Etk N-terminal domain-containing protein [Bailinhaonella thermotolerans]|nr:Wzz/FepE/Etk N-terminal domain-containing protein [Bailinhaonella thermotolerans]